MKPTRASGLSGRSSASRQEKCAGRLVCRIAWKCTKPRLLSLNENTDGRDAANTQKILATGQSGRVERRGHN